MRLYVSVFFFVKQKTAYEMRISDWSSDVCSSDLLGSVLVTLSQNARNRSTRAEGGLPATIAALIAPIEIPATQSISIPESASPSITPARSEEHTSELQSLMRISYAVFCLQKKKIQNMAETPSEHQKQKLLHQQQYCIKNKMQVTLATITN